MKVKAYLDSFKNITIVKEEDIEMSSFKLEYKNKSIPLRLNSSNSKYIYLESSEEIDPSIPYDLVFENGRTVLLTGSIVRTKEFDDKYMYRGFDLGAVYSKEKTTIKVWAPTAKSISINLYKSGDTKVLEMIKEPCGIYQIELLGDYELYEYTFSVSNNGEVKECLDPYSISTSPNNKRSIIIDRNKFNSISKKYERKGRNNAIIYETSVRDFTSKFLTDPLHSTFKGFCKTYLLNGKAYNGLEYLKDLGITHVQLLPIFGFGGVDETNRDSKYNWGYNPVSYNSLSGAYSSNPYDPYERINSFIDMVNTLHNNNINIVMDVVYNHVYKKETFPFDILTPGYAYRLDPYLKYTNMSGCGNDLATERGMVRKFILDSIYYYADTFSLDGFRFDLMGLIDTETMKEVRFMLDSLDANIITYGEGWEYYYSNYNIELSNFKNISLGTSIGYFNDIFREQVKNYSIGKWYRKDELSRALAGSLSLGYSYKATNQSISYVECHDGLTNYDFNYYYGDSKEEAKDRSALALGLSILSPGMSFISSFQESFRSKKNNPNTYNKNDSYNMIDWECMNSNYSYIENVKRLIQIRKEYNLGEELNSNSINISIEFTPLDTLLIRRNGLLIIAKNNKNPEVLNFFGEEIFSSLCETEGLTSGIGICIKKTGAKN